MNSSLLITKINDYLARYRLYVEQENRANRYNINIRAESFFIPILQLFFESPNLKNINIDEKNFPGIDLGDEDLRLAIQVTSEKSSSKIVRTLEKFLNNELYINYDCLYFFCCNQDRNIIIVRK